MLGKELMLPLEQLCRPGQDTDMETQPCVSLLPPWEQEREPRSQFPHAAPAAQPSPVPAPLLSLPDTSRVPPGPKQSLGDITGLPPLTVPPRRGNSLHHT